MQQLNDFIKNMPKAELHVHLEGSIRPDTASFLFRQNNKEIDPIYIKEFYRFGDLKNFITGMQLVSDNIRSRENLARVTRELLETLALQNVVYVEFDCAIQKYVKMGLPLNDVIDSIYKSALEAEEKYNIKSRLIVNLQRSLGGPSAFNLVNDIIKLDHPFIAGIGLSGYEKSTSVIEFANVYELARKHGLHCTAHAGEIGGPESIWQALEILKIERIDHGTQAIQDSELMEYLKNKKIPLTQCLTSNVRLNVCNDYQTHPFPIFYEKGLVVTINTDDPEVFQVSLTGEYQKAASFYNFTPNDMMQFVLNSISISFLDSDEKEQLFFSVQKKFKRLIEKHEKSFSLL